VDVIAFLSDQGILNGRSGAGNEVAFPCFFDCNEPPDSTKRKLYVNRETGFYECKVCLTKGGTTLLQKHFGIEPDRDPALPPPVRRGSVLEAATQLGEKWLAEHDDAMLYLLGEKRCLPPEVIVEARIGYVPWRESIVDNLPLGEFTHEDIQSAGITHPDGKDFFRDRILIPYFAQGRVVQLRGKDINGRYYTGTCEAVRLYNVDALPGARTVIVVEGEFDCLMLQWLLRDQEGIAVVGLAGARSLPTEFDSYLENAKRIYIGTDPDQTGRLAAESLLERIGSRARVLEWPRHLLDTAEADGLALKDVDWTTWIGRYGATVQDVLLMMREASGRRLATVAEAGEAFRNRPTTGGIKLGFAELDAWINPGLLPGQVMIPLAKTGTGKTVWLCNVAVNARKHRTLFVSLEQTREEVYERLARIMRFYKPFMTDAEIAQELSLILICDENRLSQKDFAELVEEYTETVGAKPELVIIDYLGYYARGFRGTSNYEKSTAAVFSLKGEAKEHRVAIICPGQVNRGAERGKALELDDARDSGAIEETADFVPSLYRPDEQDLSDDQMATGLIRSELLKSRHGNQGRTTSLQWGPLSLVIVDSFGPHASRAKEETWLYHAGTTYDRYLADRTRPIQLPIRRDLA
jgi:hypothetical protein